jgi:hypothetical protein
VRVVWVLILAGCVPAPPSRPFAPPSRWVHVEAHVSSLDYPALDGSVDGAAKVLILAPEGKAQGRRSPPTLSLPSRIDVGEIFRIEIRVPRAEEGERRTFRVLCGRRGLRLLDGDIATTEGRAAAVKRAIADSAGPAAFSVEEIGD